MNSISKTDWGKVDAKSEEELTRDAFSDPDNPPVTQEFFAKAQQVETPTRAKRQVTLRIDSDVLEWFKGKGKGYQTMINAVLRAYKESQSQRD